MVVFIQQHQRSPYTILLINHIIFIQFFYWLTHECRLMGSIQMRFATYERLISCNQLEGKSLNGYQTIWHLPWVVTGIFSVLANFHNPGTPSPFHYLNLERFLVLCALTGLKVCKYFFSMDEINPIYLNRILVFLYCIYTFIFYPVYPRCCACLVLHRLLGWWFQVFRIQRSP